MNRGCRYLIGRAAAALFIVLLSGPLLGIDVTQIRRVILSQEKAVLMAAESFVRTEDGLFIIPDYRDGNFKLYDDDGNLVAVWGKRGPGPLEFLSPRSCHYQPKILAVSDFSKQRILTFKRTGKTEFEKVSEFAFPVLDKFNLKLADGRVFIAGLISLSDKESYSLYSRDLRSGDIQYLLPTEAKYGFLSFSQFDSKKHTVLPIGSAGFCDVMGNYVYFIWEGNLRIIRIDRTSKARESFGEKTPSYRQPKVTSALEIAMSLLSAKDAEAEYAKMSFVNTIFADEGFIGVIYQNYDGKDSLWKMYLQLYTPAGKLIKESPLPDAVTYINFRASNSFYDRESNTLYYLSIRYDEKTSLDRYEIVAFKIESERPEPE